MTREQQILAIWCGGALVLLVVVGMFFGQRSEAFAARRTEAGTLHASYLQLYPAEGTAIDAATRDLTRLSQHQAKEMQEAEQVLVPELPRDYQGDKLNIDSNRAKDDFASMKKQGERLNIPLPTTLPFEAGLDQDDDRRSLQLAQLHLIRQVTDLGMNAGVSRIDALTPGKAYRDASGTYAVITGDFDFKASYQALADLLVALNAAHAQGVGLRELAVEKGADGAMRVRLTASLLTVYRPAWALAEESSAARPAGIRRPAGGTPTPPAPGAQPPRRSRLGGS